MGRTLRAPILKLDVNCMAAISNEKVSCTDVCITAGGCCGFAIGGGGGFFWGGGGGWVVFWMILGGVVFGKKRASGEGAFGGFEGGVRGPSGTGGGITNEKDFC